MWPHVHLASRFLQKAKEENKKINNVVNLYKPQIILYIAVEKNFFNFNLQLSLKRG